MSEQTRELARRWFEEIWNQKRLDVIEALVHPDCVGHHEGQTTRGAAEVRAMCDNLLALIPDLTVRIEAIVADESNAVVRWRFSGTSAAGYRPRVAFEGMTWLKFADGKIVEGWDRWNQAALVQQLSG